MWHSLVDVKDVKTAKQNLQDFDWLYKVVGDNVADDAAKKVTEVAADTAFGAKEERESIR